MTKVQAAWEQNQGRSSHLRHFHAPAPSENGPSRNSLLQCNKMSVKATKVQDHGHQLRFKHDKERTLKKGAGVTPFVTKVEIIKTHVRKRSKSAESVSARKRNASERVSFAIPGDQKQGRTDNDCSASKNAQTCQRTNEIEAEVNDENIEDKTRFWGEIVAAEIKARSEKANDLYLPKISEEERENEQYTIKCLTRRFRDPIQESRRPINTTRPTAAYARPTKGEMALSIKGPVLLAPVCKAVKATAQANDMYKRSRLDAESLPEFAHLAGTRNEPGYSPAVSWVSDKVVVTGRKMHGTRRVTRSGYARVPNVLDQNDRLCHSCNQRNSSSDTNKTRQRAESEASGYNNEERKSRGCLPQLLPQSSTKTHASRNVRHHSSVQKQCFFTRNGMKFPFELQVNLHRLKSYDYGSPDPPPCSPSNTNDEQIAVG